MYQLTIFYDGFCPLCVKEMETLRRHDKDERIALVDIQTDAINDYPSIDVKEASRILHAIDQQGNLVLGLDATHQAWKLVGKGWLYAPLRWPGVRVIADWFYLRFANNRYLISKFFTGKSRCNNGQCSR